MVPVTAKSALPHDVFVLLDPRGEEELLVVGKVSYLFQPDGSFELADEQDPVTPVDRHWGDPARSSVRREGDLARRKSAVDLVLNATAYAPRGRMATQVTAELRTRHFTKRLLVTGDRAWRSGVTGVEASAPKPFATMPVVYERAFGGTDLRGDNPRQHGAEPRNPVGVGFHSTGRPEDGALLPNVEDPRQPQRAWRDRPAPGGFGAVSRAWQPRVAYAGTYDAAWLADTFPLLPADFDERHYQCAPADQLLPELQPGEPVLLRNLTPEGELRLELPALRVPVYARRERSAEKLVIRCDTVLIEPDERRLIMTGRICTPLGRGPDRLKEIVIGALSAGEERAVLGGKRYIKLASLPARDRSAEA